MKLNSHCESPDQALPFPLFLLSKRWVTHWLGWKRRKRKKKKKKGEEESGWNQFTRASRGRLHPCRFSQGAWKCLSLPIAGERRGASAKLGRSPSGRSSGLGSHEYSLRSGGEGWPGEGYKRHSQTLIEEIQNPLERHRSGTRVHWFKPKITPMSFSPLWRAQLETERSRRFPFDWYPLLGDHGLDNPHHRPSSRRCNGFRSLSRDSG